MNKSLFLQNPILNIIKNSLITLPTPLNISIYWNFGSILGVMLMIQIISGLFLSMHYCPNIDYAFNSIIHIMQDVNYGWMIRNIHMNGASMFFICLYTHIGRGLYYSSFNLTYTWMIGSIIMLLSMMTAFMGYVLPWGQMSFWGATVITNLISAIPYFGNSMVYWIWGGFSINNATLNRFYSLHFIMPFILLLLVILHLTFLHQTGSNNPLGTSSNIYKIPFHNYLSIKDMLGFLIMILFLLFIVLLYPYYLSDPDNFTQANPLSTPIHIQPEWYFLFAYAILRAIPNKLGGVIALFLSIIILMILPFNMFKLNKSNMFYPFNQFFYWTLISSFLILTIMGSKAIEFPYILVSQIYTIIYFTYFITHYQMFKMWNYILSN